MNMAQHSEPTSNRLMSIDALRGFDMFWIVGGHGLVMSALTLLMDPVPDWLERQFGLDPEFVHRLPGLPVERQPDRDFVA